MFSHGRVRMASQPGLRQTGKIRVTTPLATRPRPLRIVVKVLLNMVNF